MRRGQRTGRQHACAAGTHSTQSFEKPRQFCQRGFHQIEGTHFRVLRQPVAIGNFSDEGQHAADESGMRRDVGREFELQAIGRKLCPVSANRLPVSAFAYGFGKQGIHLNLQGLDFLRLGLRFRLALGFATNDRGRKPAMLLCQLNDLAQ